MNRLKELKLAVVAASFLLSGCLAAPIVAAVGVGAGGEVVAEHAMPEIRMTGKEIKTSVGDSLTEKRTTKTLSGIEDWICADEVRSMDGEENNYWYLCVDVDQIQKVRTASNEKFNCKLTKGGIITGFFNKKSSQPMFCTIPK